MSENNTTIRRYVGSRENLTYGIANGGQVMVNDFYNKYVTIFFVNVFHANSTFVSLMLFLEGIWDTINDPIMGSVIDRTRTRFGKLRPYLMLAPLPLLICTIMMFSGPLIIKNPSPHSFEKLFYIFITYFLWEFFYTIGDVSFWGLSASLSPNPEDRTRAITSARFLSNIFSGVPTIAMPIIFDIANKSGSSLELKNVFSGYSIIVGTIGMLLFFRTGFKVKERIAQNSDIPSFRDCMNQIFRNAPLRLIILKELLGSFEGIGGKFETYYFIDVLGSASVQLLIGIPGVALGFASYMIVPFIKKRFNNKQLIMMTSLYTSLVDGIIYLLRLNCKPNLHI